MGLQAPEILDIIELAFYGPALVASACVVYRHGAGKKVGWRFLLALALVRIVGAATGIAAIKNPSTTLITVSDVMNSFGLSTLLLATIGILARVIDGMWKSTTSWKVLGVVNLPLLVGLILSIVGSTKIFSSNIADHAEGYTFVKVGVTLFLVGFLAIALVNINLLLKIAHVEQGERRLVYAVTAGMPLIAVRVTYSMIVAYSRNSAYFSSYSPASKAVIVHGAMGILPEMLVVIIYLFAGFTVQAQPKFDVKEGQVDLSPQGVQQSGQRGYINRSVV